MSKVTALGHVGIYVQDIQKMVEFYTQVLGLTLTDRGANDRGVFLSGRPHEEHHEFVFGQSDERHTEAQQISFTVGSLQDLKEIYGRVKEAGCSFDRVVSHGIAFGAYFRDPEDNRVEVYWSTGIDYPQPYGDPIDLEASDEELLTTLENLPPRESVSPMYYGKDVGKRIPAAVASN